MDDLKDDEIRAVLDSFGANPNVPINSTSRPLLLRKIAQLKGRAKEQPVSPISPEHTSPTTPSNYVSGNGFYALTTACNSDNMQIYLNKADALKAVKQISGARFKKFDTRDEANDFIMEQKWKGPRGDEASTTLNPERPNSYPSLKTQDLSGFRELIETGDLEGWETAVWQNPYYLITQGDAPVILKPPTRYNALHCAVKSGSLSMCKKLFEILGGERFWSLVYPTDSIEVRNKRRNHVTDLYLNTSDKILEETPLHFAAKYGHEGIVKYLLGFGTKVDTNRVNRYGQTPADIACDCASSTSKKQRIRDLFTDPAVFYVPVIRAVDNSICPSLSTPLTLEQLETQKPLFDKKESPIMTSAMAGPMSLRQAETFHKEWHSPSRSSERKEVKNVKRSDPDRGMERRGRHLAREHNVQWKENWEFLNCSCDLSKPEGLGTLERYLNSKDQGSPTYTDSPMSPVQNHFMNASESDDLSTEMSRLSLQDSSSVITSKSSMAKKCVFIAGPEPTKLDYDVMLALADCEIDQIQFPSIVHWQNIVRSFSEEEQKRWLTPTKQQQQLDRYPSHTFQTQQHSPSPLLYSSPKRDRFPSAPGGHPLAKQLFPSPSGTSKHHF